MKKSLLLLVIAFFCSQINAQVGINTTTPDPSSELDISSTDGGILIPRMTQADRNLIASPAIGLMIYQTDNTPGFYYYDGSSWVIIGGGVDTQNTLDEAYDEGGAGTGRIITADNGAVLIQGNDGFQNTGTFGAGTALTLSGAGTRMFFYPRKAAFRAGNVTATQWNDANIGDYSVAMGRSTIASGTYDTAIGFGSTASGTYSTALGWANTASGAYSFSLGQNSLASGWSSTVLGRISTASGSQSMIFGHGLTVSGDNSIAIGNNGTLTGGNSTTIGNDLIAPSGYEVAIGNFNTSYIPNSTTAIDNADRLFSVGNGTSIAARSNALSIYKDGTVNINDAYNMPLADGTSGQVLSTDGAGNVSFVTPNAGGVTLDGAYDFGGAGAGRTITADNGAVVIEGSGGLRVESTNQTNMLRVDGTNDAVGIGESNPISPLHIGVQTTWDLAVSNTGQDGLFLRGSGDNSGNNAVGSSIGFGPPSSTRSDQRKAAIASVQTGTDVDAVGLAFFVHQGPINTDPMAEGMRLTNTGRLGINNTNPSATLDVVGNFQLVDGTQASGYVLASDATGNASWTDPATLITDTDDQFIDAFALIGTTLNLSLENDGQPNVTIDLSPLADDQAIDTFTLIGTDLYLSLEDDGQPTQIADLSSLNSDDQTIDAFALIGTTLNLSLENDGQPNVTIDLSPLQDGTGTDDQTIDNFSLVGTTLRLSLENDGQPLQTVNLSSLQDGTGTDDQTIDAFNLAGTTLNLSLESDGQPNQTVDLSSLNTDDQTIDTFSFNNSTDILTLEIENDGVAAQTVDLSSLFDDSSWYRELTTTNSDNTTNDIYRTGSVGIGLTSSDFVISPLYVNSATVAYPFTATFDNNVGESGIDINIENASTGVSSGINIDHNSSGASSKFGIYNAFRGTGGTAFGIRNWFLSTADYSGGGTYGVYNYLNSASGSSIQKGVYNYIDNAGTGPKYGTHTQITTTSGGTHYGLYSEVLKAGSYAGYFLGRVAIGTGAGNTYILPSSRGTNGQIMQTDAAGNVSWVTLSSGESTTASNGLTEVGDDIRLGGTLTQATTISQGNFGLTYNLTGTGDFLIQDNGADAFTVEDSGEVGIGTSTPVARLDIRESGAATSTATRIIKSDNTTAITYGLYMEKDSDGTGVSRGLNMEMLGSGTGAKYAFEVSFSGTGNALRHAFSSNFSGSYTGNRWGVNNVFSGTGSGIRYGTYNNFTSNVGGAQYANYNIFDGSSGGYIGTLNSMTGTTNNAAFGLSNDFSGTGTGAKTGVSNSFSGANGNVNIYVGFDNAFNDSGNGSRWGIRNNMDGTGTGTQYGTFNDLTGTGSGTKFGTYNLISSTAGGTHYGTYSEVTASNGWAGYFVGKNYVSDAIGINNPNPDGRLDIIHNSTGAASPHIMITATNANTGSRMVFDNETETTNNWVVFARADDTSTDSRFNIFHNGTGNIMVVTGDGKVGINRTPATNDLEVSGDASKATAGSWLANSDRRLKKNIEGIEGKTALQKIEQMRGVTYLWSDTQTGMKRPENLQYGFIAQELMEVFPEKVTQDNLGFYQTAYGDYDPIFVEAIKELKSENDKLQEKIKSLESKLSKYETLEARLSALETGKPNDTTSEIASEKKE
ncbi:MAG: tail fiber domain-containing protein [Flavobacteriaceae bacterium]